MGWGRAILPCVVLVATPGVAAASPSARLIYSRTPEATSCPDESTLRKAVAARVGYDPFFPWAPQTIVVQVWREHGAYGARVERQDEEGVSRGTRELSSTASECAELFDTTALAIAIALDAIAASAAAPSALPAAPPSPTPATAPATAPVESLASPAPPPVLLDGAASSTPNLPAEQDASTPGPPPPPLHPLFLGVDALGALGTAPSATVGGAAFAGARWRFLSAALEFRVETPGATTVGTAGASTTSSVSSWLYAGSLVPCVHYSVGSACVVGMLGSLQGSSDAREPLSKRALFEALGGRLGLEWPLNPRFSLRAHLDLVRNLAPVTLTISSDPPWTALSVAGSLAVGVAAHFP
jgi:hypothetical protein